MLHHHNLCCFLSVNQTRIKLYVHVMGIQYVNRLTAARPRLPRINMFKKLPGSLLFPFIIVEMIVTKINNAA